MKEAICYFEGWDEMSAKDDIKQFSDSIRKGGGGFHISREWLRDIALRQIKASAPEAGTIFPAGTLRGKTVLFVELETVSGGLNVNTDSLDSLEFVAILYAEEIPSDFSGEDESTLPLAEQYINHLLETCGGDVAKLNLPDRYGTITISADSVPYRFEVEKTMVPDPMAAAAALFGDPTAQDVLKQADALIYRPITDAIKLEIDIADDSDPLDFLTFWKGYHKLRNELLASAIQEVVVISDLRSFPGTIKLHGDLEISEGQIGGQVHLIVCAELAELKPNSDCPNFIGHTTASAYDPMKMNDLVVSKSIPATLKKPGRVFRCDFGVFATEEVIGPVLSSRVQRTFMLPGILVGMAKQGKFGPIRYTASGAIKIDQIDVSAKLSSTSIGASLGTRGASRFGASAYVKIGCLEQTLGMVEAGHEDLRLKLETKVMLDIEQLKVILVGDIDAVKTSGWSFRAMTLLSVFGGTWGRFLDFLLNLIGGIFGDDLVEDKIDEMLGMITIELIDFKKLPMPFQLFDAAFENDDSTDVAMDAVASNGVLYYQLGRGG